jgi:hypothetical protein
MAWRRLTSAALSRSPGSFDGSFSRLTRSAPWPNETVALLRGFRVDGIAGNYDSTVATDYRHCGCKYEDPH